MSKLKKKRAREVGDNWVLSVSKTQDFHLKGLAQAKIIKKSVILFRVLNMTI